ncbi:MAG: DEAD/DEAH box helicase [Saprospiraceae bacterium]
MTFNELNLNKALLNAISDLEYEQPTPIQRDAFQLIMAGEDVVGIAQTGTGKTWAYLLPLLRLWKFNKDGYPRILVVVPTRELVMQVVNEVKKLSKYTTLRVVGVFGGVNIKSQRADLAMGCDVVVGTPGRTMDLGLDGSIKTKLIKKLVIDEVDEMLNLGFRTQLKNILDLLTEKRQNLLFSATLSDDVGEIITTFFDDPYLVEVTPTGTPVDKIHQTAYHVPNFYTKVNLLKHLIATDKSLEKVLIFAASKRQADLLHELLMPELGERVGVIHSNKSQNYRFRNVEAFADGSLQFLIATDIIARGLDILEVTHVINFDTPDVPENYIHRIGRTGRADREGEAILFVANYEQAYQIAIEKLMKQTIELLEVPDTVKVSEKLILDEIPTKGGDKEYLDKIDLNMSQGAFHEKLDKNKKVNRANEKRQARKIEKRKAKRKKR